VNINDVYTVYFLWCIFVFTFLKSEISLDVCLNLPCGNAHTVRQCAVGLCGLNSAHAV